jgi:hypothetical protein
VEYFHTALLLAAVAEQPVEQGRVEEGADDSPEDEVLDSGQNCNFNL